MKITFDPVKRDKTLLERALDFADAVEVFSGLHTVLEDDRFDYGETRFISAGFLRGRMVVIVWTQRGQARHVISMRFCHAREEARWRKHLERPG
ncbi:BrnT family toxin [Nitratireductor sp. ZSWI3]|uniref:BrnT family toxin n=1 Tax=Nitratireductor sp. ZSWI3 TaxID=2966359 RepID=UPI0021505653|nr:BrnT family toxin [Nitratireductor sp. ZSWI3]MCR4269466.1 BrnT family toxin [Nitratireductor sp. ZSWI3]